MKEIVEKCPKAFTKCLEELPEELKRIFVNVHNDKRFLVLFGFLVLEFFPKYRIEIERYSSRSPNGYTIRYFIYYGRQTIPKLVTKVLQEAIEKAFEILEARLKEGE